MTARINKSLNDRLDHLESLVRRADTLADALRLLGLEQEAAQAGAIAVSLNHHHYDLVENEGPVIIRRQG